MSPYISFIVFTHVFRGNIVQTFVWSGIVTFDDIFQDINVAMCSVFGKIAVHHIFNGLYDTLGNITMFILHSRVFWTME
jgi:hypothetical protein